MEERRRKAKIERERIEAERKAKTGNAHHLPKLPAPSDGGNLIEDLLAEIRAGTNLRKCPSNGEPLKHEFQRRYSRRGSRRGSTDLTAEDVQRLHHIALLAVQEKPEVQNTDRKEERKGGRPTPAVNKGVMDDKETDKVSLLPKDAWMPEPYTSTLL